MIPTLEDRKLNRALLTRQMLIERSTADPFEAIERLIGLQSQAPHPPYTGLWSRLERFDPETVSRGLRDRSLVRAGTLRGTVHLMTARDFLGIRPHLQPGYDRLLRANAAFPKLEGLDLAEIEAFGRRELIAHPRSLAELRPAIAERWPDRDPAAIALAISDLVPLVQLPPRGLWRTAGKPLLTPPEGWLDVAGTDPLPLETLVRRYLAAFGPAGPADMQTWSGVMGLKPVFERLRAELIVTRVDRRERFDLPGAQSPDPDTPAPVRFIAEWDNLLIGHQRRTRVMSEATRKRIATKNGMVPGTILLDGFVNGVWRVEESGESATLAITLFIPISHADRDELEAEGARLLTFLTPEATSREFTIRVEP